MPVEPTDWWSEIAGALGILGLVAIVAAIFVTPIGTLVIFVRWLGVKVRKEEVNSFNRLLHIKEVVVLYGIAFLLSLFLAGLGGQGC